MIDLMSTIMHARSFLFVPGNRPERFARAAASGADVIIIDLEDTVEAQERAQARVHIRSWVQRGNEVVVRVNAFGTPDHDRDIASLQDCAVGVMISKTDSVEGVTSALELIGRERPIIPLIESAAGIIDSCKIAATPGIARMAFGIIDYAAELGVDPSFTEAMSFARSSLVVASAAAQIPAPIDGVTTNFKSPNVVKAETTAGRRLGFTGKLCIHPNQIEPVHEAFMPSESEVEWAHGVLEASTRATATQLDGEMIDRPVVLRARRILLDSERSLTL